MKKGAVLMSLIALAVLTLTIGTAAGSLVVGFVSSVAIVATSTIANSRMEEGISMMSLCGSVTGSLEEDCDNRPTTGTEDTAYIYNRNEVDITYAVDKSITAITPKSGFRGYTIAGINNSIKPVSTMVRVGPYDRYDQNIDFTALANDPEARVVLDSLPGGKYIVVWEAVNKGVSGGEAFKAYGVTAGLELTGRVEDPHNVDTQGAPMLTMSTPTNKETRSPIVVFDTDESTTRDMLIASLTPTP